MKNPKCRAIDNFTQSVDLGTSPRYKFVPPKARENQHVLEA